MKLGYTILYVTDVKQTISFYQQAFGLDIGFIHESSDYGELKTGETKLAFSSIELMKSLGKSVSTATSHPPSFEIAFETDTVEKQFERAVTNGAKPIQPPEAMPWGQITAYVEDNNGFLVEICTPVQMVESD